MTAALLGPDGLPIDLEAQLAAVKPEPIIYGPDGGMLIGRSDGITETLLFDNEGQAAIRRTADIEPEILANKQLQIEDYTGMAPDKSMKHIASIPRVLAEKWRVELGIDVFNEDHWPAVKALLNDPDNRFVRTGLGRV